MITDNAAGAQPAPGNEPDSGKSAAAGSPRRRRLIAAGVAAAGLAVLGVPAAAPGLSGSLGAAPVSPPAANVAQHAMKFAPGRSAAGHAARSARSANGPAATPAATGSTAGADYHAYVALAGGFSVAEADASSDSILADSISADSPEGVTVTPDGGTVYVAETGQYSVIAVNASTGAETPIEVGPYPQDVAVSPDGKQVYATVTGGDTGPGGSDTVAVISTATNAVTGNIVVGSGPRQVVFSPDGTRAYITTETGIDVISTSGGKVIQVIPDPGAQGIAVSPSGKTLYVTNPGAGDLWVISASTGRVTGRIAAGAQPYAVAVTPDGSTAYVTDMNSDSVAAISTSTLRTRATVPVGRLPEAVAVTPDGSQVWVGNDLSGNISVISPATNTVTTTISGGSGTATLLAGPLGIAFTKAS